MENLSRMLKRMDYDRMLALLGLERRANRATAKSLPIAVSVIAGLGVGLLLARASGFQGVNSTLREPKGVEKAPHF